MLREGGLPVTLRSMPRNCREAHGILGKMVAATMRAGPVGSQLPWRFLRSSVVILKEASSFRNADDSAFDYVDGRTCRSAHRPLFR